MKYRNASSHDLIPAFVERLYWRCMRARCIKAYEIGVFFVFFIFIFFSFFFHMSPAEHHFHIFTCHFFFFHCSCSPATASWEMKPYISYHVLIYRLDGGPVSRPLDTGVLSRHCLGLIFHLPAGFFSFFIFFGINRLDTPLQLLFQAVTSRQ
jgi:hypothetical protein